MESIAIIMGIVGAFGGIGTVIYFSIRDDELINELESQNKEITELKGENAAYKKGYQLELKSNKKLEKENKLLRRECANRKNRFKNLSLDYKKVKASLHKCQNDMEAVTQSQHSKVAEYEVGSGKRRV